MGVFSISEGDRDIFGEEDTVTKKMEEFAVIFFRADSLFDDVRSKQRHDLAPIFLKRKKNSVNCFHVAKRKRKISC